MNSLYSFFLEGSVSLSLSLSGLMIKKERVRQRAFFEGVEKKRTTAERVFLFLIFL
jgi:hypothetical protein